MAEQTIIQATGARHFDFVDEKTNKPVKGVSLFHSVVGNSEYGEFGVVTNKITLPETTLLEVSQLPFPCRVALVTEQKLGSKGIYTKISGVTLVK